MRCFSKLALPLALVGALAAAQAHAAKPISAADSALAIVSARTGYATTELTVAAATTGDYPVSGAQAQVFKIDDPTGESYEVAIDSRGLEVDQESLELAEEQAYQAVYGKLDEDLAERVAAAVPGEPLAVAFWLQAPLDDTLSKPAVDSGTPPALRQPVDLDALYLAADTARSAAVLPAVTPFLETLLASGLDAEADSYSPVVYATVAAGDVAFWARSAEVERVSFDPDAQADLDITGPAIGADVVHGLGIDGTGVRVAQVEVGGRVNLANPFLGNVAQDTVNICDETSNHSTAVAGIITSRHFFEVGIAPGVELRAYGSCRGRTRQLRRRSNAAVGWGARALNLSFGSDSNRRLGSFDRFYDDLVQNRWRTVVVSAGNNADGPAVCGSSATGTGNVGSPAVAYNVVAVGNYDTRFTVDWADDQIAHCSSWRDPRSGHSDREKPEVSAPGSNILAPSGAAPWLGFFSGTSAAAPVVTASTALLIQRNNVLGVWPEIVKSLLMATALNDVVDNDGVVGEADGAGGIVVSQADRVLRGEAGGFGGRSYTCRASRNEDVASLALVAGQPARVVIAWDTNPSYIRYRRQPSADLDLRILDSRGRTVAASSSWDNTYEVVQFTPATTGNYTLRVRKARCSANPKWMGWAWFQEPRPAGRRGMTWAKLDHNLAFGTDRFNCAGCDAYQGETLCSEAHSILCIRPDGSPNPGLPVNFYDGWVGGNVGLSLPIRGDAIGSLANANALCAGFFGPGWQMAEFHHPLGGWGWSSHGNVFSTATSRFWVFINDQPANCWN